jgi:TetR/AcrR family transcriptional repressor of mexJK operon
LTIAAAERAAAVGRPKDAAKREAVLAAAGELFLANGLAAVSMEAVAAAAGVSKVTVYGHFGDKAALFEAVVRARTEGMAATLAGLRAQAAPLAEALPRFGVELMSFLTRPDILAADRLLAGEGHRHPELARRFFEAGPGRICAALGQLVADAAARGEIATADPRAAAEALVGLWRTTMMIELRLGLRAPPGPAEIEARVRRGVTLFLAAHAAPVATVATAPP